MVRLVALLGALFVLSACSLPSPANLPALKSEASVRPDLRDRISHRLLWLAPEQEWHYNCLFLKPIADLTRDEQRLALPSADLLFRAYFEDQRLAHRSAGFLYRQVADQGVAYAYLKLGNLILDGKGTEPNPLGGAKVIYQSALLDCAAGQHRYAELLTQGKGVATDLVAAWSWAEVAKNQGFEDSETLQKRMESVMAPAQIELAKGDAKRLRNQLNLFNHGALGKELVECRTERNVRPFITRMRACHAMGGTHDGQTIAFRTTP
ncbi:tetratricopeptide repeat protein [Terasakiella pusilla]|uniref:tetratricopeptide repeat protein n=1 Tax=Terasakiella pusilla TaxID=64973 RepID=UPI003AA7C8A8